MGIQPSNVSQKPPTNDQANAVVSGQFTGTGVSPTFLCWGPFNVSIWGTSPPEGTWGGTVRLERSFDGGTTWLVTGGATQNSWSTANQDVSVVVGEPEKGVGYRLNCTVFTTGPINYRMSATGAAALSLAVASNI